MTTRWVAISIAAATVLGSTPAAPAAQIAVGRVAATVAMFESDGSRFAAWQRQGAAAVTVYDSAVRRTRQAGVPGDCSLATGEGPSDGRAAAGRFLLACAHHSELLDARSGATTTLPAPVGPFDNEWTALGEAYVEGTADPHACRESRKELANQWPCLALYDLATGAVSYRPQSQPVDLDLRGPVPICAALRGRLSADRSSAAVSFWYSKGLLAQTVNDDRAVRLFHCHRRPLTLRGHGTVQDVEVRDGVLTWDTGHHGTEYQGEYEGIKLQHGLLIRYDVATRRQHVWRLPDLPLLEPSGYTGVLGYSTHTARAVFWIATRTVTCFKGCDVATSDVYAAPVG